MKSNSKETRTPSKEFDPSSLTLEEKAKAFEDGARFLNKLQEILIRDAEEEAASGKDKSKPQKGTKQDKR